MTDDILTRLRAYITGGRPMKRLSYRFTDHMSGKCVYHYEDLYGRVFMATSRWALFRVPALEEEASND